MTMHTLATKAMTVNLTIGLWQGHRLDKSASADVTERAGANPDAARVNKLLVTKDSLAAVGTAGNALRTHFYTNTLPWRDNGDRVLTRQLYLKFIEQHEALKGAYSDAVEKFLTEDYPREIQRAEFRMGTLFNPDDYPTAGKLRGKFYVALEIAPITTSGDFRVELDAKHVEQLRNEMDVAAEARVKTAMQSVWQKLFDAVKHAQERLAVPEGRLYDTTVTNITDLIELAPGLNLTDDPQLVSICKEIDDVFGSTTTKELRKDSSMRSAVATEAEEILEKMRGFQNIFGGA